MLVVACSATTTPGMVSRAAPVPATVADLAPYYGSYRAGDGDVFVIARLGWFFDMRTSAYRTIYRAGAPDRFEIGPVFERPLPRFAELRFGAGRMTVTTTAGSRTAVKIDHRQTDVKIAAHGAVLAAEITEPLTASPHPGIVIVHGAEPGRRDFYDVWVAVYTGLGMDVLTYDKRGIGESTGDYPGQLATEAALTIYADDAAAALTFLARWPGVDPKRVGYHGGSQGGWTVPLAMMRHGGAAFAVLASAPATTVDQTDLWAGFTGGGAAAPSQSDADMLAAVRSTHSGYDPARALAALDVPALWLLGLNDRTVPVAVCVDILNAMHKPNFSIQELPAGHALLVNATGLLADDARSPGLAPGVISALDAWIPMVVAGAANQPGQAERAVPIPASGSSATT